MSTFGRRGHWRTNSDGNTFWVSEHKVSRETYTLSKKKNQHFVNGYRLLETICNNCYSKIYYASLGENKKLFFNKELSSLSIHNCRKKSAITVEKAPLKETKPYLDANDLRAIERRAAEIKERADNSMLDSTFLSPANKKEIETIVGQLTKRQFTYDFIMKLLMRPGRYYSPTLLAIDYLEKVKKSKKIYVTNKKKLLALRTLISNIDVILGSTVNEKQFIDFKKSDLQRENNKLKAIYSEIDLLRAQQNLEKKIENEILKPKKELAKKKAKEAKVNEQVQRVRAKIAAETVEVVRKKTFTLKRNKGFDK